MISTVVLSVVAYLCGSISCAILVCTLFRLPDPRQEGSKNPGATNVLRLGGKIPALLTLFGDALKGTVPVLLGKILFELPPINLSCIGLAALIGHLFPLFFQFKGGKGVATYFGVIYGLQPLLGLLATGTWILIAVLFRYSSLAALITVIFTPLYAYLLLHQIFVSVLLGFMSLLIFITHRSNIKNLYQGTERRIDAKRTTHASP